MSDLTYSRSPAGVDGFWVLPAFWSGRGGLFGSQVLNIRDGGNFEKRARESRSVDEIPE